MTAGKRKKCELIVITDERRENDWRKTRRLWTGRREQDTRTWVTGGGRWVNPPKELDQ